MLVLPMRFGFFILAFVATASVSFADPLQYIPSQANLVLKIEKPRAMVEAITEHKFFKQYAQLPQLKEVLESTNFKRGFQLLAHLEKKLGAKWPSVLDDLGSNGIALGTVTGKNPAPLVLILEGKDEKRVAELWDALLATVEEEVQRDAPQAKIEPKTEGKIRYFDGGDFLTAQLGTTIAITNNKEAGKAIGKLLLGDGKGILANDHVMSAKKLQGGDPLAWLWYDLDQLKESQAAKDFFAATKKEFLQTVVIGSSVDAARRASFISVGLFQKDDALKLTVKLPAKRADLPEELALHVPMKPDVPGTLPILNVPGAFYSQSFYLDIATLWTDRKRLLNDDIRKQFEEGEKQISKLLPGTTLGKLLEMSGPHHRFVMTERGKNYYKQVADYPLPEMALVTSMRDPKFGAKMKTTIRTAMALASSTYTWSMKETKHDDVDIVSYYFSETKPYADDPTNFRFNFVPSFAVVNDSLVLATSPDLIKDLIPELKKPINPKACSPVVWRNRITGDGIATALLARPERSLSTQVLNTGLSLGEAKAQLNDLAKILRTAGEVGLSIDHSTEAYVVELLWKGK
jgi:hypothetical protein